MLNKNRNRKWGQAEKSGGVSKVFGLSILLCAALLLLNESFSKSFGSAAENFAATAWRTKNSIAGDEPGFPSLFSSKYSLLAENEELKKKNAKLAANLIGYDAALREIVDLRRMLGRGWVGNPVLAGVLTSSKGLPFDTLHIDAGTNLEVHAGDMVVGGFEAETASSSAVLMAIGTVAESSSVASRSKLFSSAREKTPVFLGPENISATLIGQGGGTFSTELPKDADVEVGDTAFLPGVSGALVAIVEAINPDPSLLFVTVHLRLPVNPFELRYVGIVSTQKTDGRNE